MQLNKKEMGAKALLLLALEGEQYPRAYFSLTGGLSLLAWHTGTKDKLGAIVGYDLRFPDGASLVQTTSQALPQWYSTDDTRSPCGHIATPVLLAAKAVNAPELSQAIEALERANLHQVALMVSSASLIPNTPPIAI